MKGCCYAEAFRRDVVAVARKRGAPLTQIAKDFGISEPTLHNWLKKADIEDGRRPGTTKEESAELRELRKRNRLLEQENEVLASGRGISQSGSSPKMMYPLVRDLAADGIPAAVTCRVLGFSAQSFYKWNASLVTQRDWDDAHLINASYAIHADDPAFGCRFIAGALPNRGIIAGENRVARLCSQQHIWSVFAKEKGLNRKSGPPVHDDLVSHRFTAQKPNQLWLTDITEHGKAVPVCDQGRATSTRTRSSAIRSTRERKRRWLFVH